MSVTVTVFLSIDVSKSVGRTETRSAERADGAGEEPAQYGETDCERDQADAHGRVQGDRGRAGGDIPLAECAHQPGPACVAACATVALNVGEKAEISAAPMTPTAIPSTPPSTPW